MTLFPKGPRLRAHVTGLAQPYQVAAHVGFVSGRKFAKRSNVVHREALADVLAAVRAVAVLLRNDRRPDAPTRRSLPR